MHRSLSRAVRALLVAVVVAGVMVLTPGTSWACSCVSGTPAEQARSADTVVDATLTYVTTNGIDTSYGLEVAKVYKGAAGEQERVTGHASQAACGLGPLATRQRYLFFISGVHRGSMTVNRCQAPIPYDAAVAAQVQKVTGAPTGPLAVPGSTGAVDQAPIDGTHWYTIVLTGLAVAAALGGLLLYARRSSRG